MPPGSPLTSPGIDSTRPVPDLLAADQTVVVFCPPGAARFSPCRTPRPSGLFHLAELELDRRGATKDQHGHLKAVLFVVDLFHDPTEVVEGSIEIGRASCRERV